MSARSRGLAVAALALGVLTTQLGSAQADGGALDPAFGNDGVVITATPASSAQESADLTAVVVQGDGKIVAGGHVKPPSSHGTTFAVARYDSDGSLDSSFGTGGMVTTDFGVDGEAVNGLAIQPDGKIVAAGEAGGVLALARYNPDGSLDPTFGGGGVPGTVESDVIAGGQEGVALQPDGKIIVAGGLQDMVVARYNADGSLDTSFGNAGVASTPHSDFEYGTAVALMPDGKIVVAGSRSNSLPDSGPDRSFLVERLNPDGSPDASFGAGGIATVTIAAWDFGYSLALQPDGKVLVGGTSETDSQQALTFARLLPDGVLDHSFGDQGVVTTSEKGHDYFYIARSLLLQPDGKIVAAGDSSSTSGPGSGFGLARYLPDGSLDSSFGADGVLTTAFGADSAITRAATLQPDGKIVVVGPTFSTTPPSDAISFTLARYLSDDSHSLSVEKAPLASGSGTVASQPLGIACAVDCAGDAAQFADQSLVTLTADPVPGSAVSWTGACAGSGPVCKVTMQQAAESVHVRFSRCVVPRLKGKRAAAAKKAIRLAHCSVGHTKVKRSQRVAKGRVISQHPAAGSNLSAGSRVSVVVSKGRSR